MKTLKALNSGTPGEVISAYSLDYQDNNSSSGGSYKVDMSLEVIDEMTPEQCQQYQKNPVLGNYFLE